MTTFPAGILSGTTTELGDFDQCLSVDGSFKEEKFVGKYCLATVNLPRPHLYEPIEVNSTLLKLDWTSKYIEQWYHLDNKYPMATGICFPSICKPNEIKEVIKSCKY